MGECEICGKETSDLSYVKIEGTIFKVCLKCAALGEKINTPIVKVEHKRTNNRIEHLEVIVADYGTRIRKAREKAGMTQEELAKKIKERLSDLKAIEAGKRPLPIKIARELEYLFDIELIERE